MPIKRLGLIVGAIAIAVVMGFVICKSKHENGDTWELRSYEVPPERADEVRDVLDGIFCNAGQPVELSPSNSSNVRIVWIMN